MGGAGFTSWWAAGCWGGPPGWLPLMRTGSLWGSRTTSALSRQTWGGLKKPLVIRMVKLRHTLKMIWFWCFFICCEYYIFMTHLQMSFISLGTISSLSSKGIIANPPTAYSRPAKDTRFRELRSCGNSAWSDHLKNVNTEVLIRRWNTLSQVSGSNFYCGRLLENVYMLWC